METNNSEIYNESIEKSVIVSIIFEPAMLDFVSKNIDPECFYLPNHKNIFKHIQILNKNALPIDEEFIKRSLLKTGEWNNSVESTMLDVLSANPFSNLGPYIEVLKDLSLKRKIFKLVNQIKKTNTDENISPTKALLLIKKELEDIEKGVDTSVVSIHDITKIQAADTEYVCKKFLPLPKHQVSILSAPGGVGKTYTVLQLAMHYLDENMDDKCFLWLSEDAKEKSKFRAEKIAGEILNTNGEKYEGRFFITEDMTIPVLSDFGRSIEVTEAFEKLKYQLKSYDLIILDPLISFLAVDENSNTYSRKFMELFISWGKKENKTILFIHHSDKEGNKARGASALVDAARLVYLARNIKDENGKLVKGDHVEFSILKDNNDVESLIEIGENGNFRRKIFPPRDETKRHKPPIVIEYQEQKIKVESNYNINELPQIV